MIVIGKPQPCRSQCKIPCPVEKEQDQNTQDASIGIIKASPFGQPADPVGHNSSRNEDHREANSQMIRPFRKRKRFRAHDRIAPVPPGLIGRGNRPVLIRKKPRQGMDAPDHHKTGCQRKDRIRMAPLRPRKSHQAERHLRRCREDQEPDQIFPAAAGVDKSLHEQKTEDREGKSSDPPSDLIQDPASRKGIHDPDGQEYQVPRGQAG